MSEEYEMVVRDNPMDAYRDAILHGTGFWKQPDPPPMPDAATDPYEVDTP